MLKDYAIIKKTKERPAEKKLRVKYGNALHE